jgi:hypothetical protein
VQNQDAEEYTLTKEQEDALTTYFEHPAWLNVLLSLDKDEARAIQRGKAMVLEASWAGRYHDQYKVPTPPPPPSFLRIQLCIHLCIHFCLPC